MQIFWQYLVPQHLLSRIIGGLMRCRVTFIKNKLIDWYILHYKIEMYDAIEQEPHNYLSLEDFFIRKVKPSERPFCNGVHEIVCPVDGKISQCGKITANTILQAKGKKFQLLDLLGGEAKRAKDFVNGSFMTIYLAPSDYHRVYMPFDGVLQEMIYVPGRLFSVNAATSNAIDNLYARNERLVLFFETSFGPMVMVLVGALIVSGLNTAWSGQVNAASTHMISSWCYDVAQQISLRRGEEVGYFTFGSTVILLFPENQVKFDKKIGRRKIVQIGEKIAQC